MPLHHALQAIRLMFFRVFHAGGFVLFTSLGLLIFALVFLTLGVSRWVEFLDFGLSRTRRVTLIVLHIIGCMAFSLALAVFAVDLDRQFAPQMMGLLASSLVLLFPIHIYIGLLRRQHLKSR